MQTKVQTGAIVFPRSFVGSRSKSNLKKLVPDTPQVGPEVAWSKKMNSREYTPAAVNSDLIKKTLSLTLIVLNLFLFAAYLIGVNTYAASGYKIKKIQSQIAIESERNKDLNVKLSETNSLLGMQDSFSELKFVPVNNASFFDNKQYVSR